MSPRGRAIAGVAIVVVIALAAAAAVVLTRRSSSKAPGRAAPASKNAPVPASHQGTASAVPPLPTLASVGRDWPTIMAELNNYIAWLWEHPNPSLVGNYAAPDCPCLSAIRTTLADYQAKGERRSYTGADKLDQVKLTAVIAPPQGNSESAVDLSLGIVDEAAGVVLLGPQGQVLERYNGSGPVGYDVELILGPDGQWRLRRILCLGTPGIGANQGCV
jgi:hypothetical protein